MKPNYLNQTVLKLGENKPFFLQVLIIILTINLCEKIIINLFIILITNFVIILIINLVIIIIKIWLSYLNLIIIFIINFIIINEKETLHIKFNKFKPGFKFQS